MATKVPTMTSDVLGDGSSVVKVSWSAANGNALANGDDGTPIDFSQWADRSVQVLGTFGAAGNLKWEGSNDGVTYATLNDPSGAALDIAAAKVKGVLEITQKARPRVSAGDGTTALEVHVLLRRSQPLRT
jgi:hypothetical protein